MKVRVVFVWLSPVLSLQMDKYLNTGSQALDRQTKCLQQRNFTATFKGTLPQNMFILKRGQTCHINYQDNGCLEKLFFTTARNSKIVVFWSLKLCLRYMCGAKSTWLPSMCGTKSALLSSMCRAKSANFLRTWMGAMQTLLRTWKKAMQTLLRIWKGDIISGTKKQLRLSFLPIFINHIFTPPLYQEVI